MTFYDYKVVPAPKQLKRIKGVSATAELFAATLAEAINEAAREGWEYVRAESLPATEASAAGSAAASEVIETVLVFRRPRESLGPRLASARAEPAPDGRHRVEPAASPRVARPAHAARPSGRRAREPLGRRSRRTRAPCGGDAAARTDDKLLIAAALSAGARSRHRRRVVSRRPKLQRQSVDAARPARRAAPRARRATRSTRLRRSKASGAHDHAEMRLAALAPAAVAAVLLALVDHVESCRRERRRQLRRGSWRSGRSASRSCLVAADGSWPARHKPLDCSPPSCPAERIGPIMRRPSPFNFDISASADKKRRARGRGASGGVETGAGLRQAGLRTAGQVPRAEIARPAGRVLLVLHGPRPRVQSEVELLRRSVRRGARAAVRRGPGLGPRDPPVRRDRRRPRAQQPHAEGRAWARFGFDDPLSILGDKATLNPGGERSGARAAAPAAADRTQGARDPRCARTPRPRPRSASSTRRWSRTCTPT